MTTALSSSPTESLDPGAVCIEQVVDGERADHLYSAFVASFEQLQTEAAARHLLHREEFLEDMADARITKYTVWQTETEPVALATVTNHPEAVAWISPRFYCRRHPEQAARHAIYYGGWVMVAPGRGRYKLLEHMLAEIVQPILADQGVLAWDVCAFNERTVQLGRRMEAALRRIAPVDVSVADTQTYYDAVFR